MGVIEYQKRVEALQAKKNRAGISIAELIRRAGLSYSYARRVYLGEVVGNPTLEKLEKAAARL